MRSVLQKRAGRAHAWIDWRGLAGMLLLSVLTGCGNGMSSVEGTVSLDGAPLAGGKDVRGTICFYPEGQSGAAGVGRLDANGRYQLRTGTQEGVAPGPYTVSISATQMIWPKDPGGMPGGRPMTPRQYSDPKLSGFRADVKPGSNTFDFALVSDPKR